MKLTMGVALWALLGIAGTGCIHHESTVYRDEARIPVQFENDRAARLFYESMSTSRDRREESRTEVAVPIVFEHKRRVVPGETVAFNEAVRKADTNADGTITELEATIYAEESKRH